MEALTQKDMNRGRCAVEGCDHSGHDQTLFLHGKCHPQAPVEASYSKTTGTITIRCYRCHALITEVKVAP
jgi:hypothetical protein